MTTAQATLVPIQPSTGGRRDTRPIALLILALFCLASGGIFVRLSETGPTTTAFYRVTLALPLALAWIRLDRGGAALPTTRIGKPQFLAMAGGTCLGVDLALWHKSFFLTTVANANLLANLMPFVLVPLNIIIFKKNPGKYYFLGLLLASIGLALLIGGKAHFTRQSVLGDSLAFATACFYALYLLITGKLRERYSAASLMFWSSLGCALFLLPLSLVLEGSLAITTARGWLVVLALATVSQIGGQGLLAYSIGKIGVNLSSALVLMQPLIAALYAYFLFRETLTVIEVCGAMIILAGIYTAKAGCKK